MPAGSGPHAEMIGDATAEAKQRSEERRERVLRHPDLASQLTAMPGPYRDPRTWNGYVPPSHDAYNRPNDSPRRAVLVRLCAEALRRDSMAAAEADYDDPQETP
ncbi:hypothetical protein CFN78_06920 [Amycolatopsis antarctica]|uniref:Uncharacterized protein n=1 Tax=Amycolatopsis antarctica TaxID=1854586 RepID=A0A263D6I1_9PSEU|nr:hypothetical protein [Amycolatopsis antarctica]OZM74013.1 hypothetical protein CFN78_06920 [Amycolatopsis antarctica]